MKKYLHIVMSTCLIVAAVTIIAFWELYLDDKLNTVGIVVAAKNIEENQVIKTDDVKIDKIRLSQAVDKPIRSVKDVIGLETSQFIAKGHQFVEAMVDRSGLEPNNNQLIYSIPKEWIYSSPGSLRRKDRVFIYAIPDERNHSTTNLETRERASNNVYRENGITGPILKELVVAFAKDSSNQEVKPSTNSDKRIDATGSINNLELVMTQSQYTVLEQKYLQGYRFNFAYR